MSLISDEYREALEQYHQDVKGWGNAGKGHIPYLLERINSQGYTSLLDFGCGKGVVKMKILSHPKCPASLEVFEYDPGIPEKSENPDRADIVLAADVLEHIEPDALHATLRWLRSLMEYEGYFTISLVKSPRTLPNGWNAHLIIEDAPWWMDELRQFFEVEVVFEDERNLDVRVVPCPL